MSNAKIEQIRRNPKTMLSLLPPYPLTQVARAFEAGVRAGYGRGNWAEGGTFSDYDDAMTRHMMALRAGQDIDPKANVHHAALICSNAMIMMELQANGLMVDDRTKLVVPVFEPAPVPREGEEQTLGNYLSEVRPLSNPDNKTGRW